MFDNETTMNALESRSIDIDQALADLVGKQAVDSTGLAIGTLIAIRRQNPETGEYSTEIRCAGFRDWDNGEKIQDTDVFRVYSVTKTFTADIIRQLVEQKKLKLTDKVSDWIARISSSNADAGYSERNDAFGRLHIHPDATIEDLLSHRSGIGNYSHAEFTEIVNTQPGKKWDVYELFSHNIADDSNGTYGEFSYSDTGYNLLSLIAEHSTGKSYEMLVQEVAHDKSLHHTCFLSEARRKQEEGKVQLAQGYIGVTPDNHPVSSMDFYTSQGAGALLSTAKDMLIWAEACYNRNKPQEQPTHLIMPPKRLSNSDTAQYGYGMMVQENGEGEKFYGHGGYARGGRAKVFYYPHSKTSVVTLESYENITPNIAKAIVKDSNNFKEIALLLRDLYTTDTEQGKKFDRNQLLVDWQRDKNAVKNKVFAELERKGKNPYDFLPATITSAVEIGTHVGNSTTQTRV